MILLKEDCRETMRKMPDEYVDLIVTDPAYRTISGGNNTDNHKKPSGILKNNDGKIFKENNIKPSEYIPEFYRILKPQAHLYLMTNFFNLEDMMKELRSAGFEIHNLLIWCKNNATPNRWYMKNIEYTIFARKGPAFAINNNGSKTCVFIKNPSSPKFHPTEKPLELMKLYVGNSSQEGDIVFDPFFGAGAVALACQILGRDFIGCELEDEYIQITKDRLEVLGC